MNRMAHVYIGSALLVLAATLLFFRLGTAPLWDYDESTYAIITHEALAEGHVFTPYFMEHPFLEKPPLFYFMTEASAGLLGESEFSLRLPSALAGLLLIIAVGLLAFELSGDPWAALFSSAVALSTAPLIEAARQVRLDVPVALFIILAAYGFVRGLRERRWYLLFGVALALAVLTKSVVAVFAIAAVPVFSLWLRDFSWLRQRYFWTSIALSMLVALPWHLYEALHFGSAFWRSYLGFSVLSRVSENLFQVSITNGDYIWYLENFATPWVQLFALSIFSSVLLWRALPARSRAGAAACATMALIVASVFFIAATKAPTYLVPLYPFMALALGLFFAGLLRASVWWGRVALGVALFLSFGVGLNATIYNGFHFNPYYRATDAVSLEEKAIGLELANRADAPWYVFGDDSDLGSVMYYGKRTDPHWLMSSMALHPGDLVLMYARQHADFFAEHPVSTVALYQGQNFLLLEVVPED